MGLNIKREETHVLACEVAALAGETSTQAVTVALEERLERLRHRSDADAKIRRAKPTVDSAKEIIPRDWFSVTALPTPWPGLATTRCC